MRRFLCLLAMLIPAATSPAFAAPPAPVPHLGKGGIDGYAEYRRNRPHRAFAIAPGGAWSAASERGSADAAATAALEGCRQHSEQRCVLFDVDGREVLDRKLWARLLRPYANRAEAAKAATGKARGQRFPDLAFADAIGKSGRLSQHRGKLVVLHFWGSWCAPCRHEMPELQALRDSLRNRRDVEFILLQVREPFAASTAWAAKLGVTLPLYDSGSSSVEDEDLRLADGTHIADRELANRFPTTYVIDKHGLVLLSHVGPVPRWSEYRDFLIDAAAGSGH